VNGNFGSADELFDLTLARAGSNIDRARAYRLRLRLYQVSGRFDEGMSVGLEGLKLFPVTCPESDGDVLAAIQAEKRDVASNLGDRRIADLAAAPPVTDPDVRAVLGLLVDAMPCAYIGRPRLFPLLALKAVNVTLRHGNAEESPYTFIVYGMMLVSFGDLRAAYEFSELGLRLNETFQDLKLKGTLLYIHGAPAGWGSAFTSRARSSRGWGARLAWRAPLAPALPSPWSCRAWGRHRVRLRAPERSPERDSL
jgi:predicted ATPase